MGSDIGDPDELPVHEVQLSHYWLSETPISWAVFCRVWVGNLLRRGFRQQPPARQPAKGFDRERFELVNDNKICLQYCGVALKTVQTEIGMHIFQVPTSNSRKNFLEH